MVRYFLRLRTTVAYVHSLHGDERYTVIPEQALSWPERAIAAACARAGECPVALDVTKHRRMFG